MPAVSFLSRTKNQRGVDPGSTSTGRAAKWRPLTGSVAEFGNRHVELLLVGDDGYVRNLTERLKPSGNTKTFSFGIVKNNPDRRDRNFFCDRVFEAAGSVEIASARVACRTGLYPGAR